ncbi:MAG: sulfotransferase family 2 domain-containing protein [Lentilitoribacter sp.]
MQQAVKNNIVFFHIPKTAGTTVTNYFFNVVGHENCFTGTPEAKQEFEIRQGGGDYFAAHMDYQVYASIKRPHKAVTFLRDPKKRLLSTYYFLRSFQLPKDIAPNEGMAIAKSEGLHDWLKAILANKDKPSFNQLDNFYIRTLMGGKRALETHTIDSSTGSGDLLIAKDRIRRFHAVGIVENFDASLGMIAKALELPAPSRENLKALNTFADNTQGKKLDREPITDEISELVEELTRGDQKLYEYAREISDDQITVFNLTS